MMIRQGIDIASVKRIQLSIERGGARFLNRLFTQAEQSYCRTKRKKYEHYAARFAAKEAVIKALPAKRRAPIEPKRIEVRRRATGKPFIHLSPAARKKLSLPSKTQIELSMAHEREYAIATVVLIIP